VKTALVCCLLAAASLAAWSQPNPCKDCGVVRSIREVQKEHEPPPADAAKPSGLAVTVPFGAGGADKPRIGGSQKIGSDTVTVSKTWEVVVILDDGRARILTLTEKPEVQVGDKVRVNEGKLVPRTP
jgi:hypothetical protein